MKFAMWFAPSIFITGVIIALSFFVWRARPQSKINRRFSSFTLHAAVWGLSISAAHADIAPSISLALAFASSGLIPGAFLSFIHIFPVEGPWPSTRTLRFIHIAGYALSVFSLFTRTIAYDATVGIDGLTRKTGALYPVFATYCVTVFILGLYLAWVKWRQAQGLIRAQLQYVGIAALTGITGGVTTNLLFPLFTGRSSYSWLGPYFMLPFVLLVAHAIIRFRLMDLRLVIRRGLTIAAATLMSLAPVGLFLLVAWSRVPAELGRDEMIFLLAAIVAATLLVPPTRDLAGRIFDRYVYRTHTNFRRVVREASGTLTRVLDLRALLSFVTDTVWTSTAAEGAAVYLVTDGQFRRAGAAQGAAPFAAPDLMPGQVAGALDDVGDCLVADEVLRRSDSAESRRLHATLEHLHWALLVPVVAEDAIIGAIALGPKRSGDAFYPHDMDLLMTLANQAGIAIKNAQLYTEVLLANEYIQNIVEAIESGVVAVNAAGRVSMFNRAAERLVGLEAVGARGHTVDVLPVPLAGLLRATASDGCPRTEPEIALAVDQLIRPVMCTTSPLRDPAGSPVGAVAVFSDLTPVKELERERRRGEQLAQFEALASSIAHEIRNPLVAIKAYAQLMPRRLHDDRFVDDFSRVVTREIGRMERLVERLRMLSRPGERPRQRIDVRAPLTEALEFLRASFEEKGVRLESTLAPPPPLVLGDHAELEALFINLLMNGLEASPPGGAVRVVLRVADEGVTVSVADSGPGIPPEHLDRIFDPFFTTKARGSGLGLTICAGIAAGHRAKLRAVNEAGGGAMFTLDIPASHLAEPVADEVQARR